MDLVSAPLPAKHLGRKELGSVFALNLVQGLPAYFFTLALPVVLRDAGASLDIIGLTYIVWLPWALKWIWAPVFDSRPWLRLATLRISPAALAMVFLSLIWFGPHGAAGPLLTMAALAAAIGATLQVVLAAEVMNRSDGAVRATANALQVAGMTLGGVMGGAVLIWLGASIGWTAAILLTVVMIAVAGLSAFTFGPGEAMPARAPGFRASVGNRRAFVLLFLVGLAAAGDGFLGSWLLDGGRDAVAVGWYLGLFAMLMMLPSAACAGVLLHRAGLNRTLCLLLALKGALLLGIAVLPVGPTAAVVMAVGCFALGAAVMTAVWQAYMAAAHSAAPATGFAFLTSMEAMVLMLAGLGAGRIALHWGYAPVFFSAAVAALVGAACIPALSFRKSAES